MYLSAIWAFDRSRNYFWNFNYYALWWRGCLPQPTRAPLRRQWRLPGLESCLSICHIKKQSVEIGFSLWLQWKFNASTNASMTARLLNFVYFHVFRQNFKFPQIFPLTFFSKALLFAVKQKFFKPTNLPKIQIFHYW